jgi:HK97 family phage portal protein
MSNTGDGATVERGAMLTAGEYAMNAGTSASVGGVKVTNETAYTFSAVYAAIRVLAESVASLPCLVYERSENGKRRAYSHPYYSLFHDAPSPEQTAFSFFETMMGHVLSWGNAYAELVRDGRGEVREIYPIPPQKIRIQRIEGQLVYFYETEGRTVALPYGDVLHIAGLGFDGLQGYSPVHMARTAIGLGKAAEEFGAAFFGNAAKPSGTLSHPGHLSPEAMARLRESWENMHRGPKSAGRVAIMEEGMRFEPISINPEDAQFLQTRKFQIEEIARIYRVSPMHLQDMSRATYSNFEHSMLAFNQETLRPWVVKWEQEIRRKMFRDGRFFAEFNISAMLRGDTASRFEAYRMGRESGFMSVNEIRAMENMNPIGSEGDGYLQPLNFAPLGGDTSDDDTRAGSSWYEPLVVDAVRRVLKVDRNAVVRRVGKHLERDDADGGEFLRWVGEHYETVAAKLADAIRPCVDAAVVAGEEEHRMLGAVRGIAHDYGYASAADIRRMVNESETAAEAAVEIRAVAGDDSELDKQVAELARLIVGVLCG